MSQPLRLGIAGLGTVGAGPAAACCSEHGTRLAQSLGRTIEVAGVSARVARQEARRVARGHRMVRRARARWPPTRRIDVFVELIGGDEGRRQEPRSRRRSARASTSSPPTRRCSPATAPSLPGSPRRTASRSTSRRRSAGGIPIIKTLREALAGNQIRRVYGILNGTCNYILTKMQEEQRSFADVLTEAQAKGYAEADPTFDIGGFDTAHKLALADQPRVRHARRARSDRRRGHRDHHPGRHRGRRRPRLPHQAAGRRAA